MQWAILSMSGWFAVLCLSRLFPADLDVILPETAFYVVWALVLFAWGGGIALVQWLVLRTWVKSAYF